MFIERPLGSRLILTLLLLVVAGLQADEQFPLPAGYDQGRLFATHVLGGGGQPILQLVEFTAARLRPGLGEFQFRQDQRTSRLNRPPLPLAFSELLLYCGDLDFDCLLPPKRFAQTPALGLELATPPVGQRLQPK